MLEIIHCIGISFCDGAFGDPMSDRTRIEQIYHRYLSAAFAADYYQIRFSETLRASEHSDMALALCAFFTGTSGLAILANASAAWLCGPLTVLSVVIGGWKASYKVADRVQFFSEQQQATAKIAGQLYSLIEDLQAQHALTAEMEQRYRAERDALTALPGDRFGELGILQKREIQNAIKHRIPYNKWWLPDSNEPSAPPSSQVGPI
jgi:hypothetical protein